MRAMDAVELPRKIKRVGSKRVVGAGADIIGPFRVSGLHRRRRPPLRPDHLLHDRRASTARQVLGQGNARRVEAVDTLVLGPEVQGPRGGVDENGAVRGIGEIGLPLQRAEARYVAADVRVEVVLELGRAGAALRERGRGECASDGGRGRADESAAADAAGILDAHPLGSRSADPFLSRALGVLAGPNNRPPTSRAPPPYPFTLVLPEACG